MLLPSESRDDKCRLEYFDSHAHYDDEQFDTDREEVLERVHREGVSGIINAGSDIVSSKMSVLLAQNHSFVYAAAGIHPHNCSASLKDTDVDGCIVELARLIKDANGKKAGTVVAVGEVGLDYHYSFSPRDVQKLFFARQIGLAAELGLPLVVHDRDAHKDVIDILKAEKASKTGGVMHCYSGSAEMISDVVKLGFYISIGGSVTFKNASKLLEAVMRIPADRLLIETDCPYLAPVPLRGRRNDSGNLRITAAKIAGLRGVEISEIASITARNAGTLFAIPV